MGVYDPKKSNVIVKRLDNGQSAYLTDFGDSTFINIEFNSDAVTGLSGSKGERSYAKNADNSAQITCTLKQTSPSFSFLRQCVKDMAELELSIVDGSPNGAMQASGRGYIMNRINLERSNEITTRDVIFDIANVLINE